MKDREIADLRAKVEQLQKQLQLEKINRNKRETVPPEITATVKVTEFIEVESIKDITKRTLRAKKSLPPMRFFCVE